jgi:hypothetical protein
MAFASRHQLRSDEGSPAAIPAAGESPLSIYVLATSLPGTSAALHAADSCAGGLEARIVLLVPHVVPYAQALEHPADSVGFVADRFRTLAWALGLEVTIRVCLCRPEHAALAPLIARDAVILVGGRIRRWWPTREQRLAGELIRAGHRVLFVQTPSNAR